MQFEYAGKMRSRKPTLRRLKSLALLFRIPMPFRLRLYRLGQVCSGRPRVLPYLSWLPLPGDHYLINHKGDLEVRDNEGLISVCNNVE